MRLTYKAKDQHGEETGTVWYAVSTVGDSIFPKSDKEEQALKKLAAYEDAEDQGLLVRLPCKVGDTLFFAQVGREEPFSMRVQGMSISAGGNDVILHFGGFPITNAWGSEVGKTLYLTREEAEAALKGESKDV